MEGGILMDNPCNDVAMIYLRLGTIFDHMIIKDCYEAGLMPEDAWKTYLEKMISTHIPNTESEG